MGSTMTCLDARAIGNDCRVEATIHLKEANNARIGGEIEQMEFHFLEFAARMLIKNLLEGLISDINPVTGKEQLEWPDKLKVSNLRIEAAAIRQAFSKWFGETGICDIDDIISEADRILLEMQEIIGLEVCDTLNRFHKNSVADREDPFSEN
jgi:hypothetical protein